MWRAVRLVVDTGMHYKGWSRERAIDYFTANAAKTEQDIINEIDRYLIMPGQALAYKIGQRKILELKSKTQQQLGELFDIKDFHHVVLGEGALPLSVLEERVDQYIESFKS
jgi:prolyl oligopeptidase